MALGCIDVFAASVRDVDHPRASVRAIEPLTRSFLQGAGITSGMTVLDVFSGAGDVAFLIADIVGEDGFVLGFDPSPHTVEYARQSAAFRGFTNVEFVAAEVEHLPFDSEFDAVVGRSVLMYRRDPADDVRKLARCLRPGGIFAFQELDCLAAKTVPPSPMVDQIYKWLLDTFERAGIETEMGPKLYTVFESAGLASPQMRVDGFIGGAQSISPELIADVARILMPHIEGLGIASSRLVELDTLEERMRAELARTGGVLSTPLLIGAWSRVQNKQALAGLAG